MGPLDPLEPHNTKFALKFGANNPMAPLGCTWMSEFERLWLIIVPIKFHLN